MNEKKIIFMNFKISCDATKVGEDLYVTGDNASLGNWDPQRAIRLLTDSQIFPVWKSRIEEIECDKDKIEYKYLIRTSGNQFKWESFAGNREIHIKEIESMAKHSIEYTVEIKDKKFNENSKATINIGCFKENIQEVMETANYTKEIEYKIEEEKHSNFENFVIPKFKLSKNTKDLISTVLIGDEENKSWKDKLNFIWKFLKEREELNTKNLSIIYIYLFYINSGQIKCKEDGTHFRPNHHANIAYSIFSYLLENLNENNSIVIRAILKNLPSFSNQYTVSVPLTRIRDIAHRNDIDHDLKQEIKTKLQNKLHRSASPDDLKTCEYVMKKITAPETNYSKDFVSEFEKFYEELKEFFNSLGLEKSLIKLREMLMCYSCNTDVSSEITNFLHLKKEGIDKSIVKLESLTKLRETLREIITNEMNKRDSCNKSILQLSSNCEIELEDYAYVIMSEYLEKCFYYSKNVSENEYNKLIIVCNYSIDNFILSNIKKEECQIIKEDLIYFSLNLIFEKNANIAEEHRLTILKMKSIFERCLNLFYDLADDIGNYFSFPAYELGESFKINAHTVRVFSESFVRAHFMFQFSKVITLLLSKIREILNLAPTVTISTGQAYGYCLHLEKLSDFGHYSDKYPEKSYIVFLKQSDGTEEIPNGISGIVLSHDLPQLSHLAIRARQNRRVFICCLDSNIFKYEYSKKYKENDWLSMNVRGDQQMKITIEDFNVKTVATQSNQDDSEIEDEAQSVEEEELNTDNFAFHVKDAKKYNSGSKCANLKQLNMLKTHKYEYNTPESLSIPYHVYTRFAKEIIKDSDIKTIDKSPIQNLDKITKEFREKFINAVMNLDISLEKEGQKKKNIFELIIEYINNNLPNLCYLAIRSSSNMEDLKRSAGAGLFDSYLGAYNSKENINEIKLDIAKVWASLFNQSAVIARKNSNITSKNAKMAILVQEMINIDYSFVIHTINPISKNANQVYIEMAIGLGETLANPKHRGSPYRLLYNKDSKIVEILNYASFSYFIRNGNENVFIRYKNQPLSNDEHLKSITKRLGQIGNYLQESLDGTPQDIEGGVVNNEIYLMQTRPQII